MLKSAVRTQTRVACAVAALIITFLSGCDKAPHYSQKTPEDVIATASLMVKNGDVKQLPRLIYAENKDMRAVLNRVGSLFGNVQQLAVVLGQKFPSEVAQLKEDAQKAASEGRSSSLLGQVMAQAGGGSGGGPGARRKKAEEFNPENMKGQRDEFQANITRVFADPFSMLNDLQGKLSVTPINNDTFGILYDDKPIMAPIGLTMRKAADGLWYIVLPTNLPGMGNFLPQSHDEYSILGSLIKIFDNAVIDLRRDVELGNLKDIDDVSRRAGEKAFIPMVMAFYAYGHTIEVRNEKAKAAAAPTPTPTPVPTSVPVPATKDAAK